MGDKIETYEAHQFPFRMRKGELANLVITSDQPKALPWQYAITTAQLELVIDLLAETMMMYFDES